MNAYPTALAITDAQQLRIDWSDGDVRHYSPRVLRDECPCATCREQRRSAGESPPLLPVLAPGETQPLRIESMRPVGNYAYNIAFSDGHNTGIFTFEFLRELGQLGGP